MRQFDNQLTLRIAGFIIRFNFYRAENNFFRKKLIEQIIETYKNFIIEDIVMTHFTFEVYEKKTLDLISKRNRNLNINYLYFYRLENNKKIVTSYQISFYQLQYLIRIALIRLLSYNDGFVLHASASKINGSAFIFLGKPSAGKSTLISLLKSRYLPLADDTIIIRKMNNRFYFYQTPFTEKVLIEKKSANYKIGKIFFIKKTPFLRIKTIDNKNDVFRLLIKHWWPDEKFIKRQLKLLADFINTQSFYYLCFNRSQEQLLNLFNNQYETSHAPK